MKIANGCSYYFPLDRRTPNPIILIKVKTSKADSTGYVEVHSHETRSYNSGTKAYLGVIITPASDTRYQAAMGTFNVSSNPQTLIEIVNHSGGMIEMDHEVEQEKMPPQVLQAWEHYILIRKLSGMDLINDGE